MNDLLSYIKSCNGFYALRSAQDFNTLKISGNTCVLVIKSSVPMVFATNVSESQIDDVLGINADGELHINVNSLSKKKKNRLETLQVFREDKKAFSECLLGKENSAYHMEYMHIPFDYVHNTIMKHSSSLFIVAMPEIKRFICSENSAAFIGNANEEVSLFDLKENACVWFNGKVKQMLVVRAKANAKFKQHVHYEKKGEIQNCLVSAHDNSKVYIKALDSAKIFAEGNAYIDFQASPSIVRSRTKDNAKINYPLKYVFSG